MLVGATVIADEIADAALVRGIDNPAPRTCLVDLAFGAADVVVILAFVGLCAGGMVR